MPDCLLELASHIVAYKAIIKSREADDAKEIATIVSFAEDVRAYIHSIYENLKQQ